MSVIRVHREDDQLFERHVIFGIDLEQGRGHGGELQALLDDLWRHEKGRADCLFALTLLTQCHESTKLVERTQGGARHILRQRVILSTNP